MKNSVQGKGVGKGGDHELGNEGVNECIDINYTCSACDSIICKNI